MTSFVDTPKESPGQTNNTWCDNKKAITQIFSPLFSSSSEDCCLVGTAKPKECSLKMLQSLRLKGCFWQLKLKVAPQRRKVIDSARSSRRVRKTTIVRQYFVFAPHIKCLLDSLCKCRVTADEIILDIIKSRLWNFQKQQQSPECVCLTRSTETTPPSRDD